MLIRKATHIPGPIAWIDMTVVSQGVAPLRRASAFSAAYGSGRQ